MAAKVMHIQKVGKIGIRVFGGLLFPLMSPLAWSQPLLLLAQLEQDAGYHQPSQVGERYRSWGPEFLSQKRLSQTQEHSDFESLSMTLRQDDQEPAGQLGVLGYAGARHHLYLPIYRRELATDRYGLSPRFQELSAWGVKWQHHVGVNNSFAVTARRGQNRYTDTELPNTTSTMASLSWTGRWQEQSEVSTLTGSIYFGDESAERASESELGRKYYGITLGGRVNVAKDHTPFLSFKLQKSDYEEDMLQYSPILLDGYYSQLSAGWDWRIMRNWNIRAEANYTLNSEELDIHDYDRNRIFFGTRYDFR